MKPYYQDSAVTIYHGDCREITEVTPVDLVLTDPPFEIEAHTQQRRAKRLGPDGEFFNSEPLSFDPISPELRDTSAGIMVGCCSGWILVFCQAEAVALWRDSLEKHGAKYKRACVWIKPDGMPQYSGDRPGMGYESIVTAWAGEGKSKWNGGGRHGVFTVNKGEFPRWDHQTQKPLRLITELIQLFSNDGQTVFDPFMGSGTTLRAAKDLGRKAIGIEIEEKYCEIAAKRMEQEVFNFSDEVKAAPDPREPGDVEGV